MRFPGRGRIRDGEKPRTPHQPDLAGVLRQSPADPSAWGEFVDRYGPKVLAWCRKWGLQSADAEDVTQVVLLKLARSMPIFAYDPARSFRAWLKTLAHNAWRDYADGPNRHGVGSGDTKVLERLQNIEARDDLLVVLQREHDRELLERAMICVENRVAAKTWRAFRLLVFEDRSGKDVASEVGMSVAAIYEAKSRVQEMLRDEIALIDIRDRD